jgi:hypothetical protein
MPDDLIASRSSGDVGFGTYMTLPADVGGARDRNVDASRKAPVIEYD